MPLRNGENIDRGQPLEPDRPPIWVSIPSPYVYIVYDRERDFPGMTDDEIRAVVETPAQIGFADA